MIPCSHFSKARRAVAARWGPRRRRRDSLPDCENKIVLCCTSALTGKGEASIRTTEQQAVRAFKYREIFSVFRRVCWKSSILCESVSSSSANMRHMARSGGWLRRSGNLQSKNHSPRGNITGAFDLTLKMTSVQKTAIFSTVLLLLLCDHRCSSSVLENNPFRIRHLFKEEFKIR